MSRQQRDPVNRRFHETLTQSNAQRESTIEAERAARQREIDRIASGALPTGTQSLPSRMSQQRTGIRDEANISELCTGSPKPKNGRPAALSSPSLSSTTSDILTETAASQNDSAATASLRAALQTQQRDVQNLKQRLEEADAEIKSLRHERREAGQQRRIAICDDNDGEIERLKLREERLIEMVKEQEERVSYLERRLEEGRDRERDLKLRLAEAEAEKRGSDGERRCKDGDVGGDRGRGDRAGMAKGGNRDWQLMQRKKERKFFGGPGELVKRHRPS